MSDKMNDSRVFKFETMIEDVDKVIKKENFLSGFLGIGRAMAFKPVNGSSSKTSPLNIIFSSDKLNQFGKVIVKTATITLEGTGDSSYRDPWMEKYSEKKFTDDKIKISAAKDFISYCRVDNNRQEGYKLIFWSLMILSVDDADADQKLSLICDFAKMLRITDDEMVDISYVIKNLYNAVDSSYVFKTETIPSVFGNVFNLYGGGPQACPCCGSLVNSKDGICEQCGCKI